MTQTQPHVAIIGAGIGGLAAALRLAARGVKVTVLERHGAPGGKMRTLPTGAGPVDAGPTVLTMKPVFEALFADVGLRLADHVTLHEQDILARHFWPDGTMLDLMRDPGETRANVTATFGAQAAQEVATFSDHAQKLFDAFDGPMMQSPAPTLAAMTRTVARNPRLIPVMAPHLSLAQSLNRQFTDPRLAQLFARYATYVGGLPAASPALLSLIWHAESLGVWYVEGGMQQLADAIAAAATRYGASFHYDAHVTRVEMQNSRVSAVHTQTGRIAADVVLFNGDPAALTQGHLGAAMTPAVPSQASTPRSLSACVLSFAAVPEGVTLAGHNVFFADDPRSEYAPLAKGLPQTDPTLYICAQDRLAGITPTGPERFEIILNQPPLARNHVPTEKERETCRTQILDKLRRFRLTFSPPPGPSAVTMPQDFNSLFPASAGSLYGRSPHGMMAAFKRPTARTQIAGLYLAGGGAHPGAGVPMAALSGKHAAEAILSDLRLT